MVPRARGGGNDPGNLRLAHRRCNTRRGSRVPELDWPLDIPVLDAAPLWPVVRRALRRPGEAEMVAVLARPADAEAAVRWLSGVLPLVLGGEWRVRRRALPGGSGEAVTLATVAAPAPPAGRPGAPVARSRRAGRRR